MTIKSAGLGTWSIALSRVAAGQPGTEELFTDLVMGIRLTFSVAVVHDGSQAMTGNLNMGNQNITVLNEIQFNNGDILPDSEADTMIAKAFLEGSTTSSGTGIINDTAGDFINNGVLVGMYVNIPGLYNEVMFQVASRTATSITLNNSSGYASAESIPSGIRYVVHNVAKGWKEVHQSTDLSEIVAVETNSRLIMVELMITSAGSSGHVHISYGDIPAAPNGLIYASYTEGTYRIIFRTKDYASNNITTTDDTVGAAGTYRIYVSDDVSNSTIKLIDVTEANT